MKKNNLIGKKVISKRFGEGVIKFVENEDFTLPYAVEFKKSNDSLHTCENHCKNRKGFWCTFDTSHESESEIIELVEAKAFTKEDLKVGDIITLRNRYKGFYEGEETDIDCLCYENIENDLTNNGSCGKSLDIVKVERIKELEVVYERTKRTEKVEILDEIEKAYLSSVIKPFKEKVAYIEKRKYKDGKREDLVISFNAYGCFYFPDFEKGSMYKGMEADKRYSLEELGL